VLVLPSHNECFRGLHARLDQLKRGQDRSMERLRSRLGEPRRAVDVFGALFARSIDESNTALLSMATGESIACLNHLVHRGEVRSELGDDGALWYRLAG
jgi:hypothetical protein